MEKILFDLKNVKIVSLTEIRPNSYNPKNEDTSEYLEVLESIKLKGLRRPVHVRRTEEGYEIVDGEQRWRACQELDYKNILIYDEGELTDKELQELMIAYQVQVPFDEVALGALLESMRSDYEDDFELPYTDFKIEGLIELKNWATSVSDASDFSDCNDIRGIEYKCPKCGYEWSGNAK